MTIVGGGLYTVPGLPRPIPTFPAFCKPKEASVQSEPG